MSSHKDNERGLKNNSATELRERFDSKFTSLFKSFIDKESGLDVVFDIKPRVFAFIESEITKAREEERERILKIIESRWTFDNNQRHTHTWHDMQDVREILLDPKN